MPQTTEDPVGMAFQTGICVFIWSAGSDDKEGQNNWAIALDQLEKGIFHFSAFYKDNYKKPKCTSFFPTCDQLRGMNLRKW